MNEQSDALENLEVAEMVHVTSPKVIGSMYYEALGRTGY
jgi:hypothetical protein